MKLERGQWVTYKGRRYVVLGFPADRALVTIRRIARITANGADLDDRTVRSDAIVSAS